MGDPAAVLPLCQALREWNYWQDEQERVPQAAADALVKLGEPSVLPLCAVVENGNVAAREWAVEALGQLAKTDRLDAAVLSSLAAGGTRFIALRSACFNHVDLTTARELGFTVARVPAETVIASGDQVRVSAQPGRLHFFDPETELPITA